MLGLSVQTIYNRIASRRYFSRRSAEKWANTFGFDRLFLMTGEGSLRKEDKSMFAYADQIEVLVYAVDYLFSLCEDVDVKMMWRDLLTGNMKRFRKTEEKLATERSGLNWPMPIELQKRLAFLKDYEFMS